MSETDESPLQVLINRAQDHIKAGRFAEADTVAREALRLDPTSSRALHLRGYVALNLNLEKTAVDCLEAAARIGSDNPLLYLHLGAARGRSGHPTQAIEAFDEAIRLAPELAEAHLNKGLALISLERWEEAAFAFETAKAHGAGADADAGFGQAVFQLGRIDEARQAIEAALAVKPDQALWQHNLGQILTRSGDKAGALKAFETAVDLAPGHPLLLLALALAKANIGDLESAREILTALLERDPNFKPAAALLAKLQQDESDDARPNHGHH